MIYIYFHKNDLDGICSGAIVKNKIPEGKLIGIDYGEPFDFETITKEDTVYMVDFSLQPYNEMMPKLKDKCKELIWIDHHKTAIDWAVEANFKCKGILDISRAACELVWKYFNDYIDYKNMPKGILLLGMYDSWRNQDKNFWDNEIMPFQYGMKVMAHQPNEDMTMAVFKEVFRSSEIFMMSVKTNGMAILSYQRMIDTKVMNDLSYEIEWEGYKCLVCNSVVSNSQFFQSKWDENKYDIMLSYKHVKGKYFTISLYTTKNIKCGDIAKKYGGGGHDQAAGWQSDILPWL